MQDKLSRNPLAKGNVDLIDTGDLSEGLIINNISESVFTIFSTDEKAVMIANKYGLDVYGLNDDQKKMFIEKAMVMAIESITNKVYS